MGTEAPKPSPPRRNRPPKLRAAIGDALREAGGPLSLDDLVVQVQAAVGPLDRGRTRVRGALGKENPLVTRVDTLTFDLTERRLRGALFRHPLTAAEVRHGVLLAAPDLPYLYEWDGGPRRWEGPSGFVTGDGQELPAVLTYIAGSADPRRAAAGMPGPRRYPVIRGLSPFLKTAGAGSGDDLVIRLSDPLQPRFEVSVEGPGGADVEQADAALSDLAEGVLRRASGTEFPRHLLHCLVGLHDFRQPPAPHLPVFAVAGHPQVRYDGGTYTLAAAVQPESSDFWAAALDLAEGQAGEPGAAVEPIQAMVALLRREFPSVVAAEVQGLIARHVDAETLALLSAALTQERELLSDLLADRQALLAARAERRHGRPGGGEG